MLQRLGWKSDDLRRLPYEPQYGRNATFASPLGPNPVVDSVGARAYAPFIDGASVKQIFDHFGVKDMERDLTSPPIQPDRSGPRARETSVGKPAMPFPSFDGEKSCISRGMIGRSSIPSNAREMITAAVLKAVFSSAGIARIRSGPSSERAFLETMGSRDFVS